MKYKCRVISLYIDASRSVQKRIKVCSEACQASFYSVAKIPFKTDTFNGGYQEKAIIILTSSKKK